MKFTLEMKTNLLLRVTGFGVLIILFNSCLKSREPELSTPKAYVSLMHLAPTAPSLDVYFDNNKVSNTPFNPGTVTSGYNAIDKGTYVIRFKKASSDSLVAEAPVTHYDSLGFYTIIIYNEQVNGSAKVIRIKDDFRGLETTKPYYRFFHTSPNTAAVDLYIDDVKIESDRTHVDNAGGDQLNKFIATTSGQHTIQARAAGTGTVLATTNAELIPGNAYTFYLKGLEGNNDTRQLTLSVLRAI